MYRDDAACCDGPLGPATVPLIEPVVTPWAPTVETDPSINAALSAASCRIRLH